MTVLAQIKNDLDQALRDKNELAVLTLRQVKTALINAEIANKREKLTTEVIIKIIKSEVKKRKEAIELYQQGGRDELAQKEQKEIEVIAKYLPPELGEDEIRVKVKEVIAKAGATSPADMGKIMGPAMAAFKGQADGNVVSRIVKEELGSVN